jgi:hypothetical protein
MPLIVKGSRLGVVGGDKRRPAFSQPLLPPELPPAEKYPPIGMQMAGSVLTADAAQIRSFWCADEEGGR